MIFPVQVRWYRRVKGWHDDDDEIEERKKINQKLWLVENASEIDTRHHNSLSSVHFYPHFSTPQLDALSIYLVVIIEKFNAQLVHLDTQHHRQWCMKDVLQIMQATSERVREKELKRSTIAFPSMEPVENCTSPLVSGPRKMTTMTKWRSLCDANYVLFSFHQQTFWLLLLQYCF